MPSPKKTMTSTKKMTSAKKMTSTKKMSSPKKLSMSSKPKMTDTHKAIAAASLLALLGGGSYAAYRNPDAISTAAGKAKTAIFASPAQARKWLGEQPERIKKAYNEFKITSFFRGKAQATSELTGKVGLDDSKNIQAAVTAQGNKA